MGAPLILNSEVVNCEVDGYGSLLLNRDADQSPTSIRQVSVAQAIDWR